VVGAEELDGFVRRDALRQARRLQLHADQVAQSAGFARWVNVCHTQRAAVWGAQALQALQRAGLSCTVGAEQAENLAPPHVKADAVYGDEIAVGLARILDFNYRVFHGMSSRGHSSF
jgi:hypothetical protein